MGMYSGERKHVMLERLKLRAGASLSHSQHLALESEETKTLPQTDSSQQHLDLVLKNKQKKPHNKNNQTIENNNKQTNKKQNVVGRMQVIPVSSKVEVLEI